jgi:DNA-binding MarR family transcriptional regulator
MFLVVPATTAPSPSVSDVSAAMEEFFRTLRRVRGRDSQHRSDGLSLAQFALLDALRDGRARTVGQLAEAGGVAQPTATRMLDTLAQAGLVQRTAATEDRRCVRVSLTPAGDDALAAKRAEVDAARERIAASLTEQERRDAAVLLRRLSGLLEEL